MDEETLLYSPFQEIETEAGTAIQLAELKPSVAQPVEVNADT